MLLVKERILSISKFFPLKVDTTEMGMVHLLPLTLMYAYYLAGWMTCDFVSFLTVFQSFQADGWVIMKRLCEMDPGL